MFYKLEIKQKIEILYPNRDYLLMSNVLRKPPHLGIVSNNSYLDLSLKGVSVNTLPDSMLKVIKNKNIPTIILEFNQFEHVNIKDIFTSHLLKYKKVDVNNTCFTPIKELLVTLNADVEKLIFFYEFLTDEKIFKFFFKEIYNYNLDNLLTNNCIELETYNKRDFLKFL